MLFSSYGHPVRAFLSKLFKNPPNIFRFRQAQEQNSTLLHRLPRKAKVHVITCEEGRVKVTAAKCPHGLNKDKTCRLSDQPLLCAAIFMKLHLNSPPHVFRTSRKRPSPPSEVAFCTFHRNKALYF